MKNPYQCPLCHATYSDEDDALECLGECVVLQKDIKFACPYCEEVFYYRGDALRCAAKCWIKENDIASVEIGLKISAGNCITCVNADEYTRRLFPCPYRHDVEPPESCPQYTPDVRFFGTAIATEWQLEGKSEVQPCPNS